MTKTIIEAYSLNFPPQRLYQHNRKVSFIGGEGIVRSSNFECGTWRYLVEMPQGRDRTFGRTGAKTMVLLNETELRAA
jgi:hypothetical protein